MGLPVQPRPAPAPVLIDGRWQLASARDVFTAVDPRSGAELDVYPVSAWRDIDAALEAARRAYPALAGNPDGVANFLDTLAGRIEADAATLTAEASTETALAVSPRLAEIELPRTVGQLRQAAVAARERSWKEPTISTSPRIASYLAPIRGAAAVIGPNNFPFAFNAVGGGDFAAAIATGHPVLAKANRGHPGTTRLLAEHARAAAVTSGLPPATVQLVFGLDREDGLRLVADPRVAATAFTGSKPAGLALKRAADAAGRPIYLEMSSLNPVVALDGALTERGNSIADELAVSMLQGSGQFCTSPGMVFVPSGSSGQTFCNALATRLDEIGPGTLLSATVQEGLERAVAGLTAAGARVAYRSAHLAEGYAYPTTLLHVRGERFIEAADALQAEAFGNVALLVVYADVDELRACLARLEGNLTGTVYAAFDGADDATYAAVVPVIRERVGRLLNDKVPTGIAVVPSMVHGGPYPSTGHPGFTAVGIPASFRRFAMLQCFDNVPDQRLPPELQRANPLGLERGVDGHWTTGPIQERRKRSAHGEHAGRVGLVDGGRLGHGD